MAAIAPLYAAPETVDRADTAWILSKLARPAPMHTAFVEVRDSKLLKAPLRIEGEYQRPTEDTLVREVRSPYPETTTIRSGTVSIARAGKSPRTFSLSRVPELAGLQASFGALLSGDRQLLEQHFRIASQGSHQHWTLTLTPKDKAFVAKVRDITLYGRGAELRCIETAPATPGELQRTLLAGAAHAAATAGPSADFGALCHAQE
ncbi:MAG: fatty acyl CoA synthetase [Xanthomonadaceae bacterium]|nr:fatty acyl CoA synthetase [Xanthomonadaceae bacterium]